MKEGKKPQNYRGSQRGGLQRKIREMAESSDPTPEKGKSFKRVSQKKDRGS